MQYLYHLPNFLVKILVGKKPLRYKDPSWKFHFNIHLWLALESGYNFPTEVNDQPKNTYFSDCQNITGGDIQSLLTFFSLGTPELINNYCFSQREKK